MRVIAVSTETSLAAALNMMDGWEVIFAHDPEQIPTMVHGATILLAGGGTAEGLALVEKLRKVGVELPAVVLGDSPPPEDANSMVLTPPFTLDELRSAVEHAVREAQERPSPPSPGPSEQAGSQLPAPSETTEGSNNGATRTAIEGAREIPSPPVPQPISNSRLTDRAAPSLPEDRSVGTPPAANDEEPPAVAGEASSAADVTEAARVEISEPAPETVDQPPNQPEPVPQATVVAVSPAPQPPVPAPSTTPQAEERGWLRRKKSKDAGSPTAVAIPEPGQPIAARLRAAEEAARAVEGVLADLPFLADIEMLAQGLIGELVEAYKPEIAVLYLPGSDGSFWVAGGHKITNAERRLKVKADHPLFRELFSAREPMLIAPLDLARALVSGVAGARTEALIAGPVYSGGHCVGVIVVGRDDFSDDDLDTLARIVAEAAPGLGVAEAVDRLRTFRA